jgi:hypothetical protein
VVARTPDLEAGMPDKVVVQEDVVATGEPKPEADVAPAGAMEEAEAAQV